ncbi:RHS repeat-associated core domain-containing protein [Pseudomonas putida]|nr:RHS repeat-associated core domain-containing protein [Pseudomonas putida]
MKKFFFYQGGQLSAIGSIGQISVIFRSDVAPHAEQRAGAPGKTVLLSASATNSIMHVERAAVYAPYGYFDLLRHGAVLAFNGQARDSMTACDPLGNGKRSYSSKLMRFLSPDNYSPFGLGGINTYVYCSNDPVNFTDPSGSIKYRIIMNGRRAPSIPPSAPNAIARDRSRPVAHVLPMRNGEPVQRLVQAGPAQQPALREGAPGIADRSNHLLEQFTAEERQMASNIIGFYKVYNPRASPQLTRQQSFFSVVVARHLRVESGGASPFERNAILLNMNNITPEAAEHNLSRAEQWASFATDSYRARANR